MREWADVQVAAMTCPFLHQAVSAVEHGRATKEEALIVVALGLSEALKATQNAVAEFVAHRPLPPLMMEKD